MYCEVVVSVVMVMNNEKKDNDVEKNIDNGEEGGWVGVSPTAGKR